MGNTDTTLNKTIQKTATATKTATMQLQDSKTSSTPFWKHFAPGNIKKKLKGLHFPNPFHVFKKDNIEPLYDSIYDENRQNQMVVEEMQDPVNADEQERQNFLSKEAWSKVQSNVSGQQEMLKEFISTTGASLNKSLETLRAYATNDPFITVICDKLERLTQSDSTWRIRAGEIKDLMPNNDQEEHYLDQLEQLALYILFYHRSLKESGSQPDPEFMAQLNMLADQVDDMSRYLTSFMHMDDVLKDMGAHELTEMNQDTSRFEQDEDLKSAVKEYSSDKNFAEIGGKWYKMYQVINNHRRGLKGFSQEELWEALSIDDYNRLFKTIRKLDTTMEENGLEKDIILFRGTNLEGQINPKLFLPGSGRDSLSGSIIKDKGFLSTSRDISTADNFISLYRRTTINSIIEQIVENGSATDIPLLVSPMVKIKILARKKAHAYDIAAASKFGASEQEVLFASNTAMRIYEASAQKKEVKLTEYDIDTYDDKVKQKNRRKWKKIKEKLIGQTFSVYMPELSVEIV